MKKYLIFLLSLFSILFVGCDIGLTPSNPIESNPPVNEIRHKITFHLDDKMTMEETEIEYVEGVGLETLPIPIIDNEDRIEEFETIFIYWIGSTDGNEPSLKIDSFDNEVFVSISKEETRDLDLYPRITTKKEYNMHYAKYEINMEEKFEYPGVTHLCLDSFPEFKKYGLIELNRKSNDEKVTISEITYYKVNCYLLDIYDEFKLTSYIDLNYNEDGVKYFGNCNEDGSYDEIQYFVYVPELVYETYKTIDEFIVPMNIKYFLFYDQNIFKIYINNVLFPDETEPIASFEFEYVEKNINLDFYPVIDNIVLIDQSNYFDSEYLITPYLVSTYKTYINKNLDLYPTIQEFETWITESILRTNRRIQYNDGSRNW